MPADPAGTDPTVLALARENERLTRRVGGLETQLASLADAVARIALDRDAGNTEGGPRSWLLADDPAAAAADLDDLAGWLAAVYVHFPDAVLPSCWPWHPAAVEELWWLRNAHHDAYSGPGASWQRVADWHDRHRPGVGRRLRSAIGGCELAEHAAGAGHDRPAAAVPSADAAQAVAAAWTATRGRPEPTRDQLDRAAQHDRAQHARSSR